MIARADGQVVLVTGAIPGERVRARVVRVGKNIAYADAIDIEESSPDRRGGSGDPLCGGCSYAHIAYLRQLELKSLVVADAFARIGRLQLPVPIRVVPSPEDGYRMRARLHVRGFVAGFFREGTHSICDARATRQLLPSTCDTIDRVLSSARSLGFDSLREIELSENLDASERAVFLDAASPLDARALDGLAVTEGLTGMVSTSGSRGEPYVVDRLTIGSGTFALRRHVRAFFQGNRHLLRQFVARIVEHVPERGEAIDLYAGVGLIALSAAAARNARVTAVEGDRHAAADLVHNAAAVDGAVLAVHQSVEAFVASASPVMAPTVIADPPRTGMSREALAGVIRMRPSGMVYVSCDVATLARDARRLIDAGYAIASAHAFDLFPNTPHVETIAVFESGSDSS